MRPLLEIRDVLFFRRFWKYELRRVFRLKPSLPWINIFNIDNIISEQLEDGP